MTVIPFDEAACRRIRARLDAYLSNELAVETVAEVERHLASCGSCSKDLAAMEELRSRLRSAVRAQTAPDGLRRAVTAKLRPTYRRRRTAWPALAAAVLIALGAGFVVSKRVTGFLPHELLAIELEVRSLVKQVAAAYAPAIIDHLHCALYRQGPKTEVMPEKIAMELGEQAPAAAIVKEAAGPRATMLLAHKCHFGGREFLHMILMDGESLVSVVVTKKREGESLAAEPRATRAAQFEIAGFEAGGYLAFVISDMTAERNLELARNLEAPLRRFLG
jgi:anti-sigma factor (TIGR02949 family)